MDEGLLNDLLECSVCLERLDTSSRVLPCQHTFCLKCLKVIVESHKELRCPECRVLVESKIEELPPNVLLMRILEGMKNSAPKKATISSRSRSGHLQVQGQQGQSTRGDLKQVPPHARAMYDYISKEPGDLSFKKGETILLQKKIDTSWYHGECSGRSGMFPINYVQVVVPLPLPPALCKALYDFRMSAPDEEGCLAFDKGAIITVHRRVDENWAEGRLDQRVGIFPIAFVELNQAAKQLMNSVPLSRPVPSISDGRSSHSDRHHASQHPHRYQQMSMSIPTTAQATYQNVSMSQSHPNYQPNPQQMLQPQQILLPQSNQHSISGGILTAAPQPRNINIVDPTHTKKIDIFSYIQPKPSHQPTMALQSVSRVNENFDRLRSVKYDNYNMTVHKPENTYQNVRPHEHFPVAVANFNNASSDSSSSVNTPSVGVSSTTTPNTSSNTSTCESAEPSLPSSPDNNTERNPTVIVCNTSQNQEQENESSELNTSMGVLNLNESSTATNTSLNVSLPPAESPKLNPVATSDSTQKHEDNQEIASSNEPRLDGPSSSKTVSRSSGPDSLLNFGLGLQAALSPSQNKESNYMSTRNHREHHREREKRHSLTPSSHLQGNHSAQNRHSAEIVATSLLDHTPERDRDRDRPERERERRRRRSRSNEQPLPATYVALYPYKPQKPDELELKKGGTYTVTERCRDGWYKGWSERSRVGPPRVFPGNYVAPKHTKRDQSGSAMNCSPSSSRSASASAAASTNNAPPPPAAALTAALGSAPAPPDAPPRAPSPSHTPAPQITFPWNSAAQSQQSTPKSDKSKDKAKLEKSSISSGVSLMKRLAAMKKCKSPPPAGYSMDNPVFEDGPGTSLMLNVPEHHPVHVRSGSCPSQLLRTLPASVPSQGSAPGAAPSALDRRAVRERHAYAQRAPTESPWQSQHRKSQSLDVTAAKRDRHHTQPVKERFRCIVPYPPNSEYELELKVDDIVIVSKKRGDGWYKGTLQRTGRTGLFPASFVQSCPQE